MTPFTGWRSLEAEWQALAADCAAAGRAPPFFLSAEWLGSFCETMAPVGSVFRAFGGERLVGLGLLGQASHRRRLFRFEGLALNETGDPVRDTPYTEYNGLLAHPACEGGVVRAFIAGLSEPGPWQSLKASGVPAEGALAQGLLENRAQVSVAKRSPSPYVTLSDITSLDQYAAHLSTNTRAQLRQSLTGLSALGPLALEAAPDLPTALTVLEALSEIAVRRAQSRGQRHAFQDPRFQAFTRQLLHRAWPGGRVELLTLKAGEQLLGALFMLIEPERALVYQSAFETFEDNRLRPAYAAHGLAICHYAARGLKRYHFLAGDQRFKKSLSTGTEDLLWLTYHRPSWKHAVEDGLDAAAAAAAARLKILLKR